MQLSTFFPAPLQYNVAWCLRCGTIATMNVLLSGLDHELPISIIHGHSPNTCLTGKNNESFKGMWKWGKIQEVTKITLMFPSALLTFKGISSWLKTSGLLFLRAFICNPVFLHQLTLTLKKFPPPFVSVELISLSPSYCNNLGTYCYSLDLLDTWTFWCIFF